jgi:hypothetical protein
MSFFKENKEVVRASPKVSNFFLLKYEVLQLLKKYCKE